MDINTGVIGLLFLAFGLHFAYAFFNSDVRRAPTDLPWVPIDVSKSRSFVSQTRDAGMYTEFSRRKAIIGGNTCGIPQKRTWNKSFSNGVMETFLTAICPALYSPIPPCDLTPVSIDGGDALTESCVVFDGNGDEEGQLVDLGNANTNVCSV
jgi:hypothetical protein